MRKRIAFVAAAAALLTTPAWASDRGSMEDQLACTPDVYRLCSQYIPNEDTITACLQRNLATLSSACHKVFTRPPEPAGTGEEE